MHENQLLAGYLCNIEANSGDLLNNPFWYQVLGLNVMLWMDELIIHVKVISQKIIEK